MKMSSELYLKWLAPKVSPLPDFDFFLTNQCVVTATNNNNEIVGVTLFEPKDFSDSFLKRLEQRRCRSEFSDMAFSIFLPNFLRHRADALKAGLTNVNVIFTPFINIKKNGDLFFLRKSMRVVSVDDSPVLLKFLKRAMEELGFIEIVAQVTNSEDAVSVIQKLKPDLVTLDIQMPKMTGVDVLKELFKTEHFPVIMISSLNLEEGSLVFDALNSGAFDYIQKPKLEELETFKDELSSKMLSAVIGRGKHSALNKLRPKKVLAPTDSYPSNLIWCLGASTGGTQALTRVFTSLPAKIPPTLIVQHIPPVFSRAFAESLNQLCPFTVKEAENGEMLQADHVYIAPGGIQMGIEGTSQGLRLFLKEAPPVNRFKPSVDFLFMEVAKLKGILCVASVLTGMGRDGAQGLLALKKSGARTFVQDEESSAVFGMPRVALEVGGANEAIPLDEIASKLLDLSLGLRKAG